MVAPGCASCRNLPRSANASARSYWSGGALGAIPKLRAGCSSHRGGTNSLGYLQALLKSRSPSPPDRQSTQAGSYQEKGGGSGDGGHTPHDYDIVEVEIAGIVPEPKSQVGGRFRRWHSKLELDIGKGRSIGE